MSGTSLLHQVLSQHQTKAVEAVDRYWHQHAALGRIPRRSDINPSDIQDALEYAFVAEQIGGGHARFRVAGGALSTVFGMEVAGMPLAMLVTPDHRARFTAEVERVFSEVIKLRIGLSAPAKYNQPAMEAEMRLFPLLDAMGRPKQVLGTFVANGHIGRTPRRFEMTACSADTTVTDVTTQSAPILTREHLSLVISNA